jgi:hypothetical protein
MPLGLRAIFVQPFSELVLLERFYWQYQSRL